MKAWRFETWGVHLGWAVSFMGGWLVRDDKGNLQWHFRETNVRRLLEEAWAK